MREDAVVLNQEKDFAPPGSLPVPDFTITQFKPSGEKEGKS